MVVVVSGVFEPVTVVVVVVSGVSEPVTVVVVVVSGVSEPVTVVVVVVSGVSEPVTVVVVVVSSVPVPVVVVVESGVLTMILPSLAVTRSVISLPFVSNTLRLSISTAYSPGVQSAGIVYSSSITVLPFSDLIPAPTGLANAY